MAELQPFIRWLHLVAAATWTGGSPASRGIQQLLILVVSLAIFAAAVAL